MKQVQGFRAATGAEIQAHAKARVPRAPQGKGAKKRLPEELTKAGGGAKLPKVRDVQAQINIGVEGSLEEGRPAVSHKGKFGGQDGQADQETDQVRREGGERLVTQCRVYINPPRGDSQGIQGEHTAVQAALIGKEVSGVIEFISAVADGLGEKQGTIMRSKEEKEILEKRGNRDRRRASGTAQPGETRPTIPLKGQQATVDKVEDERGVSVDVEGARRPGE